MSSRLSSLSSPTKLSPTRTSLRKRRTQSAPVPVVDLPVVSENDETSVSPVMEPVSPDMVLWAQFDFRGGSVGNFVFTGARLFFSSLTAAIFWFSNLVRIPATSQVVPVIIANKRVTIGARLRNGQEILGQDEISHPCVAVKSNDLKGEAVQDSPRPVSGKTVTTVVDKAESGQAPLPSPIERIFYVNPTTKKEVTPIGNPVVFSAIEDAEAIIYSMGSLYTSIIPSLIVPGVGSRVLQAKCPKILLLNGSWDRETHGMTAVDFVIAIYSAIKQGKRNHSSESKLRSYSLDVCDRTNDRFGAGIPESTRLSGRFTSAGNLMEVSAANQSLEPQSATVRRVPSIGRLRSQSRSPGMTPVDLQEWMNQVDSSSSSVVPSFSLLNPSKISSTSNIDMTPTEGAINDLLLSPPLPQLSEILPSELLPTSLQPAEEVSDSSGQAIINRRETSAATSGLTLADFHWVTTTNMEPLAKASAAETASPPHNQTSYNQKSLELLERIGGSVSNFVTHILYVNTPFVRENMLPRGVMEALEAAGVRFVSIRTACDVDADAALEDASSSQGRFDVDDVVQKLQEILAIL